jgi:hypothetical protein
VGHQGGRGYQGGQHRRGESEGDEHESPGQPKGLQMPRGSFGHGCCRSCPTDPSGMGCPPSARHYRPHRT